MCHRQYDPNGKLLFENIFNDNRKEKNEPIGNEGGWFV